MPLAVVEGYRMRRAWSIQIAPGLRRTAGRGSFTGPMSYDHPLQVGADAIDDLDHVNNVVFLQWIQDAAAAHWTALTTPEQRDRVAWVVIRHEVDYLRQGFVGDRLVASTWVGEVSAATCERFTRIRRPADGADLVRARSVWCAYDPGKARPRRIDDALLAIFRSPGVSTPPTDGA